MLVTLDALLQGLGVGLLSAFLVDLATKAGHLEPILAAYNLPDGEVSALWPRNPIPSHAAITPINYLVTADSLVERLTYPYTGQVVRAETQ